MKKIIIIASCLGVFTASSTFAEDVTGATSYKNSFFYGGLIGGYADVDWSSVVVSQNMNLLNDITTATASPIAATGTGFAYGVDLGYQFSSYFAVEGQYIRMPTSQLTFAYWGNWGALTPDLNPYNLSGPNVDSNMNFWSIIFKVMTPLGHSGFSLFIDAGPAYQWQTNVIANIGTFAPTFGGGLDYRINQHWFAEGSFQYAPGTGESIPNPMIAFIPELYIETFKINYIF
ncbi:MAG: outer membrane beta-barrel protein [Gammaproteobacteria bacterium]|nr:outer membrane beta-barrel protein [Gammaproteobacteria bacterium]